MIAGLDAATGEGDALGLDVLRKVKDGQVLEAGDEVLVVRGPASRILRGEDRLLGPLSKPSGVATASWRAVTAGGGRVKIVAGAWKKVPSAMKPDLRQAVQLGGAALRITEVPFLYLDKNYIRAFGGIGPALEQTQHLSDRCRVIQLRGETRPIGEEAGEALRAGAGIVMIDTARPEDIEAVSAELRRLSGRRRVQIAFGGRIQLEDIADLSRRDVDILDIGTAILDAPWLDLRYEVLARSEGWR